MQSKKNLLILGIALLATVVLYLFPAIPQDQEYHQFVDQRTLLSIPHFWNVVSNVAFVIAGAIGLMPFIRRSRLVMDFELRWVYALFFAGILLVGFGSGYYHLDPTNASLVWDRLPMTVAFISFFTVIIGERISLSVAQKLLVPLLAVGVFSVFYWHWTEQRGEGDLRLYALVQFLPMLLIVIILCIYPARFTHTSYLIAVLGIYMLAKLLELFDEAIYSINAWMSGHALKHFAAALAPCILYLYLKRRKRIEHRA